MPLNGKKHIEETSHELVNEEESPLNFEPEVQQGRGRPSKGKKKKGFSSTTRDPSQFEVVEAGLRKATHRCGEVFGFHLNSLQMLRSSATKKWLFPLKPLELMDSLCWFLPMKVEAVNTCLSFSGSIPWKVKKQSQTFNTSRRTLMHNLFESPWHVHDLRKYSLRASKAADVLEGDNGKEKGGGKSGAHSPRSDDKNVFNMDYEERMEWRSKIREVMSKIPNVEEEVDPEERSKKIQKLLADYPLVVEEEDPNWPEDADGWGFNLGQFFNKISIKNVKKDDDENYDSENEIVWQDDDYIRPIKDITSAGWDEAVFKDISPLVVLVHNRYKRPKENEKIRDELEKAVHIIWNCRLPSPRCVAIDAVVETELVSTLKVSVFPELIFTKAGKILYREKAIRSADELSKMMAFYYYGAVKPPCLSDKKTLDEDIPSFSPSSSSGNWEEIGFLGQVTPSARFPLCDGKK
ncbi:OLC1v1007802C1 [Oldenlandia corymbosa var. corymbosa]|uniref:OLC1v1007802C1 n=1 Tax=Oldenlandia corymbosa var. corymbosa TaxID=529605 RepID=A0AAV1DLJ6_OLDCO|nr:OLC1v1007802C1 [Oldenlandia corymbosa var. corymbosa]